MDSEAVFIRCATHGALFEPQTGLCIQGPCRGESLWQLSCSIADNSIHLDESELPSPSPCAQPI
jgi:nitrite reductase/ring-hydroxylating ferredoxin subunit